jgi:hypothetical protein
MTKKFDSQMEEFFDIDSSDVIIAEPSVPTVFNDDLEKDFVDDYKTARSNIDGLIEQGKEALNNILEIAKETEQPRSFEVAATLLRDLVAANHSLIAMHKSVRDISNYKSTNSNMNGSTINNTLFVGSTAELSKLVKELKESNYSIIDEE